MRTGWPIPRTASAAGDDAERRLAIMKDSRIGSFGALALIASVALRAGALAQIAEPRLVVPRSMLAGMAGRAAMPGVVLLSAPARPGGLAASLGQSPARASMRAGASPPSSAFFWHRTRCCAWPWRPPSLPCAMSAFGRRTIGGYTGDTLGAAEQLGEIAALLVMAAALGVTGCPA